MTHALAAFLLGRGGPPPAESLRRAQLSAYAYTVLPVDHPERAACRADYLAALGRHHAITRELAPLLTAWRAAGVQAMLFKGFYLAEFVYPVPGARFHGDVDVLIRSADEALAISIAAELGWADELHAGWAHGVCGLYVPAGAAYVDLHRLALHSYLPWPRRRRITERLWALAHEVAWAGTRVLVPDPRDALLILVLQRSWGGEHWRLKPSDVLDVRALTVRFGLSHAALLARAHELGCRRTLERFLARCDAVGGRLDLTPPSRAAALRWDMALLPERRTTSVVTEEQLVRLFHAAQALVGAMRAIPTLLHVRRALRMHADLRQLLASLTPVPVSLSAGARAQRVDVVRGVRWAARLFRQRVGGPCVVRSLALYVTLRRRGWPAAFVSGVGRETHGVVGHAWVELDGRVLPELNEPLNRERFRVNFQYPEVADA